MKLGELFMTLGFDVDDKKLKEFDASVKSVAGSMAKTVAVVTGALYAIDRFTAGTIRNATAMASFNNQTGLSTKELMRWQSAAQLSNLNISASDVLSSIQAIQENLTAIKLGGGNVSPFQMLGIDISGKNAFDILEQMRARIKGMDRSTAVNLMQQMGINPEMLNVLQLSNEEFEKLANQFQRTKEMTQTTIDLGIAINKMKLQFSFWKDELVVKIAPAIIKAIDLFYDLANVIKGIGHAMEKSATFRTFIYGLAAAFGVLMISISPITMSILAITAAFTGLMVVLDDFADYINGEDNYLAKMVSYAREFYEWISKAMGLMPMRAALKADKISPEQLNAAMARAQGGGNNMTVNNNIKIEATGITGFDDFRNRLETDMNNLVKNNMRTLADFNNSGR